VRRALEANDLANQQTNLQGLERSGDLIAVAAELEAARTVQHVLIPEEIPAVPGFTLQSVY
jgi:hypothetical protein